MSLFLRRMLAISVIACLGVSPLYAATMKGMEQPAQASLLAGTAEDMLNHPAKSSVASMADAMTCDMPCCPSNGLAPIGCDKCIFMASCAGYCFPGLTAALFQPYFASSAGIIRPQNDFRPDGLGHSPPEHPPRSLV